MTPRVENLFVEALALPPSARSAFLDQACGNDSALKAQVASLISAHQSSGTVLDAAPVAELLDLHEESSGNFIGRYKLLQKIGEGGCGVVWMAEQEEPVRRRVALKVIKLGMDTKAVVARFQAERQALALMDHPHIARVFDAGATERGRPYFVMELVRGTPITRYCDENKLEVRERLELFVKVCQAIQHAHQKGIIHRDIKPSNILVTINDGEPTPKVIDFGIAKATQGRLTDATVFTAFEQFIGTPVYMSPEQAEMSSADIDTRSDIYSLGVLLYELLTGQPPFDARSFAQAGVEKIRHQIREVDPARPSARWLTLSDAEQTTAARQRGTVPSQLCAVLRSDIDWIVMRCLEKNRTRRYDTANGLAMDVRRFLDNEPVAARAPSTAYLLRKLVQRHRVAVTVGMLVFGLVVAGAVLVATQARRALRAERMQAEMREAARQEQLRTAGAKLAAQEEQQRNEKQRWTRQYVLPEIQRLREEDDIAGAFAAAVEAEKNLRDDPELTAWWPRISLNGSVNTEPEGADVLVKPYSKPEAAWQFLGKTLLKDVRLARAVYRFQIKKDGFEPELRGTFLGNVRMIKLTEAGRVPSGMVYIPTRSVNVAALESMPDLKKPRQIPGFFIDRHEVTNREYKAFVDRGGYEEIRYWKESFIKDGKERGWPEAVQEFRDSTGKPGPSTWAYGTFAAGQEDFPVSGVSWYEAAAYAEFVGKRLPSIHHWLHVGSPVAANQKQFANFDSQQLRPVGQSQSMSAWGTFDMAGNVKEWCSNERESGLRYLLGGSAWEPSYVFDYPDAQSPWARGEGIGFRCIQLPPEATPAPDLDEKFALQMRDFRTEHPASDEEFNAFKNIYSYERAPLEPKTEFVDETSSVWRKERVSIKAAYGDARLPIILMMPKSMRPPYQAVIYFPPSGALNTRSNLDVRFDFFAKQGRAIIYPIYDGTYERGDGTSQKYLYDPNIYPDFVVHCAKDLNRTIDYLETRSDIRSDQLGFYGRSLGAMMGSLILAVEPRIKAALFVSGGVTSKRGPLPHVDQVNLAPRIRMPVLMLNGRFDATFVEASQRQLFRLLGTPPDQKQYILNDGPHVVPNDTIAKESGPWFDRYLGPIRTQ